MPLLRDWQKKCIGLAIEAYKRGQQSFLCVAAPGAGKTLFSATLAKVLLDEDEIDIILCFAPTVSVANGIRATFRTVLDDPFDGRIVSKGLVTTYQGLQHSYRELAYIIKNSRVLIISDEIHHCAFGEGTSANQWGLLLESLVESGSPLRLTLSGTPWRSDSTKIALQSYSGEPQELHTDFVYGLRSAVADRVCRTPRIILLDNGSISVQEATERYYFNSIADAIDANKLKYSDLLTHSESLRQLISHAHRELQTIRRVYSNAAGLVVASSVEQAKRISQLLEAGFNQTTIVVSYNHPESHQRIQEFQNSNVDWIVSIGMVSEGTDIPRLHVCAYLSNVRTELYYRQVLGRILRINEHYSEPCSLFAFAEPKIKEFSERINQDLPSESMTIKQLQISYLSEDLTVTNNGSASNPTTFDTVFDSLHISGAATSDESGVQPTANRSIQIGICEDAYRTTILSL